MRLLPILLGSLVLAACGDDEEHPPTPIDGPVVDAPAIDGPSPDAPPDAATDAAVDARIDAPIDAGMSAMVNGCTAATAVDRTAFAANRTITFPGFAYTPPCMTIKVGQTVTWSGDLGFHPLRAGLVVAGVPTNQPGNPVPSTSAGASASATFAAVGEYGYYCLNHVGGGMMGAIYVVP